MSIEELEAPSSESGAGVTGTPRDSDEQAHRSERSLRIGAALVGVFLTSPLLIPWRVGEATLNVFELADRFGHVAWVVLPLLGTLFLVAAFLRGRTLRWRRLVLLVAGLGSLTLGLALLQSDAVGGRASELRSMIVGGTYFLLLAWVAAAAFDIAIHQAPRSRSLARGSALAWLAYLVSFATPLVIQRGEPTSVLASAFRSSYRIDESEVLVLGLLGFIGLLGVLQAARRAGADRDAAAGRFFRRSGLAYLLLPIPLLAFYMLLMPQMFDGNRGGLTSAHNAFSLIFGTLFGGALGIGHGLAEISTWSLSARTRKGFGYALAASAVAGAAALAWPSFAEGRVKALSQELAQATATALSGGPVEERFLGGYEEFDLRSAPGALAGELPPGTELDVVFYALNVSVRRDGRNVEGWVVLLEEGDLRWVAGGFDATATSASRAVLGRASPALVELADMVWEDWESGDCLPGLTSAEVEPLPAAAQVFLDSETRGHCGERAESDRWTTFGGGSRSRTTISRYVLVVRDPRGTQFALEGSHHFDSGRLWIGAPAQVH